MKSPFARLFGGGDKANDATTAEASSHASEEVVKIPLEKIHANQFQPRTVFDEEKIEELARTIHVHGVIQPIVVRDSQREGFYEIIAGERRFRAMTSLGWEEVPAIVRQLSDKETASIALIENLQREELTAIEEAHAYSNLLQIQEITQEALAQRLGKSQSAVANKLRLLKLPEIVQQALLSRSITERHARALLPVKDPERQQQLLEQLLEEGLNVKELEQRIRNLTDQAETKPKKRRKAVSRDMRIAMNTIKESLSMVKKSGIKLDTQEEEHEDYYQITVKIPKKRS
ncbi:nucleoid occlusion protein [Planococcus maritimus]|uniref:Nucleoid occlusion protein n=1 Tax=Planococcus maritimus TaxID=192421 RepID=A0A7D7MET6_PLAMR|nr:nucleoid occlusion protein [Planococcus maritimus]OED33877.1 nucleoid occlusion protein [Planococcus maritimus]QMT17473.1 nucleoid occlusion protein [Planococcus maritimus]